MLRNFEILNTAITHIIFLLFYDVLTKLITLANMNKITKTQISPKVHKFF